jgi:hypothetical protein
MFLQQKVLRRELLSANGHGVSATLYNVSRCRHGRFPYPGPLPEGQGESERAMRDFHGNTAAVSRRRHSR